MIIFRIVSTIIVWAISKRDESAALIADIVLQFFDALIEWLAKHGYLNLRKKSKSAEESSVYTETQNKNSFSRFNNEETERNGDTS